MKKRMRAALTAGLPILMMIAAVGGCGVNPSSSNEGQNRHDRLPDLRALQVWQKDDYNTYPVAAMLERETGYRVHYDRLPQDKPEDKLNILMASDEAYDVVTLSGSSDMKALWADYAKRGELTDLGPLIESYGANIQRMLSRETLDAAKVDGRIYAIPTKANPNTGSGLLIRLDWLERVGLELPDTLDEFTNILRAFKALDPGGNGTQNIPLAIRGDQPFVDNISGAFGMANNWNDNDGVLIPRALDAAYPAYVAYMALLYREQLLDPEFVLNKDANVREKFSSGKAGVIATPYSEVPVLMDGLNRHDPGARATFLSVMTGPDGERGFAGNASFSAITFIPKKARNPVDAVKWLNAKLDPDVFKNLAIGEEGVHHTYKDGKYEPILPIFADERNAANNYLTGIDEHHYYDYWRARVLKDIRLFEAWEVLNVNQPEGFRIIDPLGISPYLEAYSKYNLQLNAMVAHYTVKLILGLESLNGLDAFIQQYRSSGGDESLREVNAWYANKASE